MRIITLSVLLVMALVCSPAWAGDATGWEPVESPEDPAQVRTWVKKVEGAPVKAFRGEVEVPFSWLEVLSILDQIPRYPQWVFRCKSAQRVEGGGLYLNFKGGWPVSDRDVYTQSHVVVSDNTITIQTGINPSMNMAHEGHVRIATLQNSFDVVVLESGKTRVVFTTFVDPGGSVPRWLSNMIAVSGPLETLEGMKRMLEQYALGENTDLNSLSSMYDPVKAKLAQFQCSESKAVC